MSSMLNLPGELLKSGVSNVVSGGRRLVGSHREDGSHHPVKDKTTIQVKGTPPKDAMTTTNLSIKSGYLMKRNEQGQYHRRYVCTVPHLFLYYFDNEMADSPHGIIDLELFSKIEIEDDNETIKLSASEEMGLRSYHLQLNNANELNDWVASLLRDRFHIIKEERDAYRALQDQFTGEMEVTTQQAKNSSADMERLLRDVMEARRETEEAQRFIATALSIIGISEEEMRNLSTTEQYGSALSSYLKDFIQAADNKTAADKEEFDREMSAQEDRLARLEEQCEAEREARKQAEVRCSLENQESEQRVRDAVNQMDQTALNMQMAVAAKVAAESKCSQLAEQKKLLVKEVKQQRKRIDELSETIAALRTAQQQTLQQLAIASQNNQQQNSSSNSSSRTNSMTAQAGADLSAALSKLATHPPALAAGASGSTSGGKGDSDDEEVEEGSQRGSGSASDGRSSASAATASSSSHSSSSATFLGSMFGNISNSNAGGNNGGMHSYSTSTGSSTGGAGSGTTVKNNAQPVLLADDDMFRPSLDASSNTSMIDDAAAAVAATGATASGNASPSSQTQSSQQPQCSSTPPADGPSSASTFKLRCLRCNGTVEGPKYSTCKCAVPAMCLADMDGDEKPAVASGHKSGGGNAAEGEGGGSVGGLFKAAGGMMSNIGRRASLFASGGGSGSNA